MFSRLASIYSTYVAVMLFIKRFSSETQTLLICRNYFCAVPTVRITCLAVLTASSRPAESIRAITVSSRHCRCSTVRADLALCTACQSVVRTVQTLSVCTLITPHSTYLPRNLPRSCSLQHPTVGSAQFDTTAGIRPICMLKSSVHMHNAAVEHLYYTARLRILLICNTLRPCVLDLPKMPLIDEPFHLITVSCSTSSSYDARCRPCRLRGRAKILKFP